MKRIVRGVVASVLLVFALCQSPVNISHATTIKDVPIFMEKQSIKDGRDEISMKKYDDNGKVVYTCSEQVKDKEAMVAMLENKDLETGVQEIYTDMLQVKSEIKTLEVSEPTGPDQGWAPVRLYHNNARAANNSSVATAFSIYAQAYSADIFDFRLRIYGGQTSGSWYGQGNAEKIVLRQTYNFSGLGVSISWPLSIGLNNKEKSYEWVSSDFDDAWLCTASHEDIMASNWIAAIKVTVADGADVYIGSTCYKARCEITKDWHAVYYNEN